MLRLLPLYYTDHTEQFLCSDNEGHPQLSQPGQGFVVLCGEPAHISKTPYIVKGATPAAAWTNWYARTHPGLDLSLQNDGGVPGDVVLRLPNASTLLPPFRTDGWEVWLHDETQNVAILFRSEHAFSCSCWHSRHAPDNQACQLRCPNALATV